MDYPKMMPKISKTSHPPGIASHAAVAAVGNRYDLILIAARRVRELNRGAISKVARAGSNATTALMEIEAGKVGRDYLLKELDPEPKRQRRVRNTF